MLSKQLEEKYQFMRSNYEERKSTVIKNYFGYRINLQYYVFCGIGKCGKLEIYDRNNRISKTGTGQLVLGGFCKKYDS